jgi:hypothetical protein
MNQNDDKPALYALTKRQRNAIAYALGYYDGAIGINGTTSNRLGLTSAELASIATLLEQPGLDFSAVVPLFGEDESDPYVAAALGHASEGELEVDVPAVVSRGDDPGAYVMAWIWITDEEAGVSPADVTNDQGA